MEVARRMQEFEMKGNKNPQPEVTKLKVTKPEVTETMAVSSKFLSLTSASEVETETETEAEANMTLIDGKLSGANSPITSDSGKPTGNWSGTGSTLSSIQK